jgi:hypothetical protein
MHRREVREGEPDEVVAHLASGGGGDGPGVRDDEHDHAGGLRRGDTGRGVLDNEAVLRCDIEQRCGTQVALGGGLPVRHVVTAHDGVERHVDGVRAAEGGRQQRQRETAPGRRDERDARAPIAVGAQRREQFACTGEPAPARVGRHPLGGQRDEPCDQRIGVVRVGGVPEDLEARAHAASGDARPQVRGCAHPELVGEAEVRGVPGGDVSTSVPSRSISSAGVTRSGPRTR